jgi:cbb3-type cytochrome oxidase subunit 3
VTVEFKWIRTMLIALAVLTLVPVATAAAAPASPPPDTSASESAPVATNDLLPQNNDLSNCVGTVERANCGSDARADWHTYLVFAVLVAGLAFIFWRISKGVRAREAVKAAHDADEDRRTTLSR